jgi:hypothetical protein
LLTVGTLGLLGLNLPDFLRRKSLAAPRPAAKGGYGNAQSVILLYLQGSPSHIDLWDPKPAAPAEIRGEFQPIATRTPGIFLGEVLPRLAQESDKFALVRSTHVNPKGLPNHGSAIYMLLTGHDSSNFTATGLAVPPTREDLPSVGATAIRFRPAQAGRLGYVALSAPVGEGVVTGLAQGAGLLGGGYDPLTMYDDPTGSLRLEGLTPPAELTPARIQARRELRSKIARLQTVADADFDPYFEKAASLVESSETAAAFRLDSEPTSMRERYGMSRFGQSCLLARRLVEAGARFVQVNWPARADQEPGPGPDGSWDTHRNNFPMLREHRAPVFDLTMSALLADLSQRGLLESTLVVAIGEFGRSPRIGAATTNNVGPGGRDHWPHCYSFLIAGGGVRGGQVYGESDKHGAYPKQDPVHPWDMLATVYHLLGIAADTQYLDALNRPRRLVQQGSPILGLV